MLLIGTAPKFISVGHALPGGVTRLVIDCLFLDKLSGLLFTKLRFMPESIYHFK